MRDANEEVIFRFTDVAAIEGSRGLDTRQGIEETLQDWLDCLNFAFASGRPWTGEHRTLRREDGSIFDKCRVGIPKIGIEDGEFEAAY